MNITKSNIKKILIDLSREYDVRLHFTISQRSATWIIYGYSRYWNDSITINLNQSANSMLSTFFHEIGHVHCWKNSLWSSYHIKKSISQLTKIEKEKYIRTALKAERWVDKWAKKEMAKHFDKVKYKPGYSTKEEGDQFLQVIKKMIYE